MLVAPKVLVSMMSAPASRKRRWMSLDHRRLREREEVAVVEQVLLARRRSAPRMSASVMP
jgi:hypothetical protein